MLRSLLALSLVLFFAACGGSSRTSATPTNDSAKGDPVEHGERHGHGAHGHGAHGHGAHGHGAHGGGPHGDGDQPLGRRFEDADEWAERFDNPERDAWQMPADVVKLMSIEPGMTVADIGAGTGYFLPYLSTAAGDTGSVLGLDIEADMVRYMEERAKSENMANVSAKVVGVKDPGLAPESVDRVLVVDTWHHVPERVEYTRKIATGLRPGGSLYIVDFTLETERGPHKGHRLSPESIIAELEAAGLKAELMTEPLPDQFIVRGTRK